MWRNCQTDATRNVAPQGNLRVLGGSGAEKLRMSGISFRLAEDENGNLVLFDIARDGEEGGEEDRNWKGQIAITITRQQPCFEQQLCMRKAL